MSEPSSQLQSDLPWYRYRTASSPFFLAKKLYSNKPSTPFRTIAFFPWSDESLKTLWGGSLFTPDAFSQWKVMISKWSDAVAVSGDHCVYVFFIDEPRTPMHISLPQIESTIKPLPTDSINIAWAIQPGSPLEPLLVFSHMNLLYIYNVEKKGVSSYLRGHGGAITSIAIHPINTNIFCTTSRDYSVRIYDLNRTLRGTLLNPPWPPASVPSLAGAPHGLHMSEAEGTGIGQCLVVLMGGRSGGHQAAVLSAAFHPQLPLIATCGLDRLVKIWFVPLDTNLNTIRREDKPLFSSSKIHKACVLSIAWLGYDMLLTHCTPALMKTSINQESKDTFIETGQMAIWRWLGIERFFPSGDHEQIVLRGCASDYQESVISTLPLPRENVQTLSTILHLYQSPTHDPIVLITRPGSSSILVYNVVHLQPRKPPPFLVDQVDLVESTQNIHLSGGLGPGVHLETMPWTLQAGMDDSSQHKPSDCLMRCAMGKGGTTIVGASTEGTLQIWKIKRQGNHSSTTP
ncbi:WD40-repeat-containing domain protein [Collybia nuda]|uniref:WD40-repeat-containing domain protein n=1 Tax=Collybia nuda TaxID=64659 RepID=A0A9P5XVG4_9AGAR|nr:WD40-repeat-containing domain protein [Collybia nuda]